MGPGDVQMSDPPKSEPNDKERIAALENEAKKLKEGLSIVEQRLTALEQGSLTARAIRNANMG